MENFEVDSFNLLKNSFDWLDKDQDGKISLQDLEQAFDLSKQEASQLFNSLSKKSKSFLEFHDFYSEVSSFPSLLTKFKKNPHSNSSHLKKISEILQIFSSEATEEVQLLKISEKLKDLSSFQNETLVILCSLFFGYLNNLHDTLKSFEEFQSCKNLEETLKVEALIQDKLRTEKNYKILLSEHKDSEKTIKSLEDQLLLKEKELKNLQIKILENESDLDSLSLEAESLKYSLKQRERTISNLNKQLSQAKTLTHIEKTSQKSHSREVKTSKTPKGLKTFQLDPIQPSKCDSAKDQVIKNLKNQLTEKISSFQRLESRFYEIEKEKQELKEKVKILSLRSRHCSEEEEFQFETIASLKDELLVIDSGFIQSSIPSHFQIISKDSAVQVDCVADKKKGRFSCFSFFT